MSIFNSSTSHGLHYTLLSFLSNPYHDRRLSGLLTEQDLSEEQKTIFLGSYEGQRNKEGKRHGFGRFVAPKTGNVYEGYYFNDRKEGAGK